MDDAARVRAATRDAIDDITPPALRDLLVTRIEDSDVTPGVLVLLSARATEPADESTSVERRAAGVQLIYDGLALTRTLARDPTWSEDENDESADMAILAADVLVGRGFYLLARTEAAPTAVETVRAFGRDETVRQQGQGVLENALEADVFELAIVAGTTAVGGEPPPGARGFAVDLADSFECGEGTIQCDPAIEALDKLLADRDVTPSPDRVWAGSSGDP